MPRLEPTRTLALRVWWAFLWRSVLFSAAAVIPLALGLGLLGVALKLGDPAISRLATVFGALFGAIASVEALYRVLRSRFKGFEIALLGAEAPEA